MTVTKLFPSGAWEVSGFVGDEWFRRTYYGYTKRDAMQMFRADTKAGAK